MRIVEPFVKAHLALWLVDQGATSVAVSVDGAEPNPGLIQEILMKAGFAQTPNRRSVARWTGRYLAPSGFEVVVQSIPGVDVKAALPNNRTFVAECKGEPTQKGTDAGNDKTAFYTGLGQLIMSAGRSLPVPHVLALALPATARFRVMATEALSNSFLRKIGLTVFLINDQGGVSQL